MVPNHPITIPAWWPAGKTVLVPKTKGFSDEKIYRPCNVFKHFLQNSDR